jgi:hypothetical protein
MVQREGLVDKLHVSADGTGQVGHAGSALVAGAADRIGLTQALSGAMAPTRERRSAHDPGVVLRDLAVMLADGGDCLADLGAQRDQPDLFGGVASDYQPATKAGDIGLVSNFAVWLFRFHSQKAPLSVWMSCWRTARACRLVSMLG